MPSYYNDEYDIEKAFAAIEQELISSMIRNLDRHRAEEIKQGYNWEQWQVVQLQALERYKRDNIGRFQSSFSNINSSIDAMIRAAREAGSTEQEQKILRAIKKGYKPRIEPGSSINGEFFKLSNGKLEALIKATTDDMKKAEYAMLRMSNDKYRQIIFNSQVYFNLGAGTYEKAVDMATKDFLRAGINCIEYKDGSRHNIKSYSKMAIKTANTRAYLAGEGDVRKAYGVSTVYVDKNDRACPKCARFVGKILIDDVWSGGKQEDGDYPLMSQAIAAGMYHPNCRCTHTTYYPGITKRGDKMTSEEMEELKREYEKEQRRNYAEQQAEKLERMSTYSLDADNKRMYAARAEAWQKEAEGLTNGLLNDIITSEDIYYLNQAKSFESYIINEKLRQSEKLTEQENKLIKGIDTAIMKLPDYSGIVYRSVGIQRIADIKKFEKEHQPDNIVRYPSYTSASLDVYDETMEYQFIITSKHGKNMIRYNRAELEVIFKRETRFYITKRIGNTIWMEEI